MRGGTSKGVVFRASDLPRDRSEWDQIFLNVMGSPDPNGRQLDGMGGGLSSLSKICILAPPSQEGADFDYTFAQVSVGDAVVDYAGTCGNMAAAVGPAALELGLVTAEGERASLRVFNTNTGRIIETEFPIRDGKLAPSGDFAINGVSGSAAPIQLRFESPGGAKTGRLLPTGNAIDVLELPQGRSIQASLIDAANPCVFVAAAELRKTGAETPEDLERDTVFLDTMESARIAGSVAMGLTPNSAAAREIPSIPKIAIVTPPTDARLLDGSNLRARDCSLGVRMISMGQVHRAVPITGAICLAVASRLAGSIVAQATTTLSGPLTLAHPSGTLMVDAEVDGPPENPLARNATVYRTARLLFSGLVYT